MDWAEAKAAVIFQDLPYFSKKGTDLKQEVIQALRDARNQGLEEAAKEAERVSANWGWPNTELVIIEAIRGLKDKP